MRVEKECSARYALSSSPICATKHLSADEIPSNIREILKKLLVWLEEITAVDIELIWEGVVHEIMQSSAVVPEYDRVVYVAKLSISGRDSAGNVFTDDAVALLGYVPGEPHVDVIGIEHDENLSDAEKQALADWIHDNLPEQCPNISTA